jgi:hypothetical protein
MPASRWAAPGFLLWVQAVVWLVVALVMALTVDLVRGPEKPPMCPNVFSALGDQGGGIPFDLIGLSEGLIFIGFLWFLSGVLAWVYTRYPRFFLSIRVSTGRVMGPTARRAGLIVMAAGVALLCGVQAGCLVTA